MYLLRQGAETERITDNPRVEVVTGWSRDGTRLLVTVIEDDSAAIYTLDPDSRALARLALRATTEESR